MDSYVNPHNDALTIPAASAGDVHRFASAAARGLLENRAWGYSSTWALRRYADAAGIPAPSDAEAKLADKKREELFALYLDLALDLAALAGAARRSRDVESEGGFAQQLVHLELLGGYGEPPDLAGDKFAPDALIKQYAERTGKLMRDTAEALRELVRVLRGIGDPRLDPLIERCAEVVRRTLKNPGV